MPEFSLTTLWSIPAPAEAVWSCLVDTESWPSWWRYVVAVNQTAVGDASGINNIRCYQWRTCLPYRLLLTIRVTEIRPLDCVAVEVSGDLQGSGYCRLSCRTAESGTQVLFQWDVRTCKPWMDWFTVLTRPIFIWNHAQVMKQGERDLIRYLSTQKRLGASA